MAFAKLWQDWVGTSLSLSHNHLCQPLAWDSAVDAALEGGADTEAGSPVLMPELQATP